MLLMCAVLPAVQLLPGTEGAGLHEDTADTLAQLAHSPRIRAAALWLMLSLAAYNVAGGWGGVGARQPGGRALQGRGLW